MIASYRPAQNDNLLKFILATLQQNVNGNGYKVCSLVILIIYCPTWRFTTMDLKSVCKLSNIIYGLNYQDLNSGFHYEIYNAQKVRLVRKKLLSVNNTAFKKYLGMPMSISLVQYLVKL
jgi:hypothetical protein